MIHRQKGRVWNIIILSLNDLQSFASRANTNVAVRDPHWPMRFSGIVLSGRTNYHSKSNESEELEV